MKKFIAILSGILVGSYYWIILFFSAVWCLRNSPNSFHPMWFWVAFSMLLILLDETKEIKQDIEELKKR